MPADWLLIGTAAGRAVAKLWFQDHPAEDSLSNSLLDWVGVRFRDRREARSVARHLERVGDRISDDLEAYFRVEFRGLADNEQSAAVQGIVDGLASPDLTYDNFAAANFEERFVVKSLVRRAPDLLLSSAGETLYSLLATEVGAYVVAATLAMPEFSARVGISILRREAEAFAAIDEALTLMPKRIVSRMDQEFVDRKQDEAVRFELEYRRQIVRRLDDLAIYGLNESRARRRPYPLSIAYVSLTARRAPGPGHRDESIPIEDALAEGTRFVISGEAGSGKTTILQWIAVQAARRTFSGPLQSWNAGVPFFLQLRGYAGDTALPTPSRFVEAISPALQDDAPKDWVVQQLRLGRALVLVDGLDELVEERREEVAAWLHDLSDIYPHSRFLITSRPPAVARVDIPSGFARLSLEPMTGADVLSFVDHWHRAAALSIDSVEEGQDLVRLQASLTAALADNTAVRSLMSNPLLCAMVCTLNMERRGLVPQSRIELYDAALRLLIRRRDLQRGLDAAAVTLDEASILVLLWDIAYWMLRNDEVRVSSSTARRRVQRKLVTLTGGDLPAADVMQFLIERSGVLRESAEGEIDFVHLSFQEYLAGLAVIDDDAIGEVLGRVRQGQWFEVAVNAAGHAGRHQREELVSGLLSEGADARRSVLAMACVGVMPALDPQLTAKVRARALNLLPPRSPEEAHALASSGSIARELLSQIAPTAVEDDGTAAAIVRAVARVGGESGVAILHAWREDPRASVQEELVKAWPSFEAELYAREVLSGLRPASDDVPELVAGPIQAPYLRSIPWLRTVVIEAAGATLGLEVVPAQATAATIRTSGAVTLAPVDEGSSLRQLALEHFGALEDLSGIARARSLESVRLTNLAKLSSIAPLTDLPRLRALQLTRLPNLVQVPSGAWPSLTELRVEECSALKKLDKHQPPKSLARLKVSRSGLNTIAAVSGMRRLRSIAMDWIQDLASLDGIAGATELRDARWAHCANLEDIGELAGAARLERLALVACPAVSVVAALSDLPVLRDLELIQCRGLVSVEPLSRIPQLESLDLTGCSLGLDLGSLANVSMVTFPYPT